MPISRYNPDGSVDIYNAKTGEVRKGVSPDTLAQISPTLVAEYQQNQTPQAQLERKKAEQALTTVEQPEVSAAQEKASMSKESANRVLAQLEQLYYGKGTSADDLSKGRLGGLGTKLTALLGMNQPATTYEQARKSSGAQLARALGDVGNLNEKEQAAAIQLLPTLFSTPEEAAAGFNAIRAKLGLTEGTNVAPSLPQRIMENPIAQGLAQFGENAQRNTNEIVRGVGQLPNRLAQAGEEGPVGSVKLLMDMLKGTGKSYADLITNPVETVYKDPVTTFFNLIPFAQGIRSVDASKLSTKAAPQEAVSTIAQTPRKPNIVEKLSENVKTKAAEDLLKSGSGAMNKAFDAGIDPRKVVISNKLKGSYDDLLGPIEQRGYAGKVGTQISDAEKVIQSTLDKSDDVISWEPVINELTAKKNLLAKLPTNADKVSYLDEQINLLKNQPSIPVKDALESVRSANETFGNSIVQDAKGAISTQVNKTIANTLRDTLKTKYPQIAEALKKQQELIITREILKDARGASSTGGLSGMTRLDLTQPLRVLEPILKNARVSSGISGGR